MRLIESEKGESRAFRPSTKRNGNKGAKNAPKADRRERAKPFPAYPGEPDNVHPLPPASVRAKASAAMRRIHNASVMKGSDDDA